MLYITELKNMLGEADLKDIFCWTYKKLQPNRILLNAIHILWTWI